MSNHPMVVMTLDRLQHLVAAYGADPRRWPESERDSAAALISGSVAARDLVARAYALDSALAAVSAEVPEAAMARLTAAAAFPHLRQSSSPAKASVVGWRDYFAAALWPRATVFASMMALGIITGLAIEPVYSDSDAYAMVVGDLSGDMDEDLGL